MEIIHEESRSCLADLAAQAGGVATNLTFYIVKLSDTLDGLVSITDEQVPTDNPGGRG